MVLRLTIGILLARILGADGYGIYAYAIAWVGLLSMPSVLGLDQVLVRHVAAYSEKRSWAPLKGLIRFSSGLGLATGLVVGVVSVAVVASLSGMERELQLTLWVTFIVLPAIVGVQLWQAALRGLDRPARGVLLEGVTYPVCLLAFSCVLYLVIGPEITAPHVALANATAWLITFVLGATLLLLNIPAPVRQAVPSYEKSMWLDMVPPLVFIGLVTHILLRASVIVMGIVSTTADVGIYTAASGAAGTIQFVEEAMMLAGASLFSRIYASGNTEELQRFVTLVCRAILGFTLPVYVVFMVGAPWIMGIFGDEFVRGAGVMRLLTTTHLLGNLGGFVMVMLYMVGRPRDVAVAVGFAAALSVVLSLLLIPKFGILGAGIASGVSLLLLKATLVVVLYKRVGVVSLPFRFRAKTL